MTDKSLGKKIAIGAAVAVPVGAMLGAAYYLEKVGAARDRQIEQNSQYDTSVARNFDRALIKYAQVGKVETAMKSPAAIAVDAKGRLLVAGDKVIRTFTADGQKVGDIDISGSPNAMAVAPNGTIYVAFMRHVESFAPDGTHQVWPAFEKSSHLTSISATDEAVFVGDWRSATSARVYRCTPDGKVLAEMGQKDDSTRNPGLHSPSFHMDVAATADGAVWVANPGEHRVELYNRNGELSRYWGQSGSSIEQFLGCCNPANFRLFSDGRVVTAEKGVARLKVYLPDGRLDCVVAGPESFGPNARGMEMAIDPQDRVMVLEPGTTTVKIFAANTTGAS